LLFNFNSIWALFSSFFFFCLFVCLLTWVHTRPRAPARPGRGGRLAQCAPGPARGEPRRTRARAPPSHSPAPRWA
jgi:hypothetical protein